MTEDNKFTKRKATVTITKTVEIDIAEACLTDAFLDAFEQGFWELDEENTSRAESLISYIQGYLAQYEDADFIEGVGKASSYYYHQINPDKETAVIFKVNFSEIEVEAEEFRT